jgi:hypothetical protein
MPKESVEVLLERRRLLSSKFDTVCRPDPNGICRRLSKLEFVLMLINVILSSLLCCIISFKLREIYPFSNVHEGAYVMLTALFDFIIVAGSSWGIMNIPFYKIYSHFKGDFSDVTYDFLLDEINKIDKKIMDINPNYKW